jgi:hypothetical protein
MGQYRVQHAFKRLRCTDRSDGRRALGASADGGVGMTAPSSSPIAATRCAASSHRHHAVNDAVGVTHRRGQTSTASYP